MTYHAIAELMALQQRVVPGFGQASGDQVSEFLRALKHCDHVWPDGSVAFRPWYEWQSESFDCKICGLQGFGSVVHRGDLTRYLEHL